MKQENIQEVYQLVSYLLRYPDKEMSAVLEDIRAEVNQLGHAQIQDHIDRFVEIAQASTQDEWTQHYIELFDFGKTTNLYVTYLKLGEQRERGLELLKLKKKYAESGFEVTDKELPDYLPIMLEFCANVSDEVSKEILSVYGKAIKEIREKLVEAQSFYTLLLDALLMTMEEAEVFQPV